MSEGLRAEDVKEALEGIKDEWLSKEGRVIVAAARDHLQCLASQATTEGRYVEPADSSEQAPDYEAAAKVYWESKASQGPYEARSEREKDEAIRPVARAIVDAALVGFHPQPTEEQMAEGAAEYAEEDAEIADQMLPLAAEAIQSSEVPT